MASTPTPPSSRPPELAAASEDALELVGAPASISLTMPSSSRELIESAAEETGRILISVEDIEAERDPGLAYAVYLDSPGENDGLDRERRHIGNVSFFGIEKMNDPDQPHDGAPGFRHTFDATDALKTLKEQKDWDPASMRVTFEPITLLPPPGEELPEEAERTAQATPVRIGRVSLFVV
jgi:hypothetical protein